MTTNVVHLVNDLNERLGDAGAQTLTQKQWSVMVGYLSVVFWNIDARLERLSQIDEATPMPESVG